MFRGPASGAPYLVAGKSCAVFSDVQRISCKVFRQLSRLCDLSEFAKMWNTQGLQFGQVAVLKLHQVFVRWKWRRDQYARPHSCSEVWSRFAFMLPIMAAHKESTPSECETMGRSALKIPIFFTAAVYWHPKFWSGAGDSKLQKHVGCGCSDRRPTQNVEVYLQKERKKKKNPCTVQAQAFARFAPRGANVYCWRSQRDGCQSKLMWLCCSADPLPNLATQSEHHCW